MSTALVLQGWRLVPRAGGPVRDWGVRGRGDSLGTPSLCSPVWGWPRIPQGLSWGLNRPSTPWQLVVVVVEEEEVVARLLLLPLVEQASLEAALVPTLGTGMLEGWGVVRVRVTAPPSPPLCPLQVPAQVLGRTTRSLAPPKV